MPTAPASFCPWDWIPGQGGAGLSHSPRQASSAGHRQALAGEETSRAPSPLLPLQSGPMAPGPGLTASLALCRPRAPAAPDHRAPECAVPGTVLLLLGYLAYLALGTGVFWVLERPAARDSSARFQREKWALLQNFTCLDGPALDSLIRVRGERGRRGTAGARGHALAADRAPPGALRGQRGGGVDAGRLGARGPEGRAGPRRDGRLWRERSAVLRQSSGRAERPRRARWRGLPGANTGI